MCVPCPLCFLNTFAERPSQQGLGTPHRRYCDPGYRNPVLGYPGCSKTVVFPPRNCARCTSILSAADRCLGALQEARLGGNNKDKSPRPYSILGNSHGPLVRNVCELKTVLSPSCFWKWSQAGWSHPTALCHTGKEVFPGPLATVAGGAAPTDTLRDT